MPVRARKLLVSLLIAIFLGQTWLVYSDPIGTEHALSDGALAGQAVWRKNNCQSCHQLFGFGGFLGPDLTNTIGALSSERLTSILTIGAGQMPAFELDAEQCANIATYLREIDATGISQPKLGDVIQPMDLIRQFVEAEDKLPAKVKRGWEIAETQTCIACHLPNQESLHRSTDLTKIVDTVERERLFEILVDGIPGKGMPRLMLSPDDCEAVLAFLVWMNKSGEAIRGRFENLPTTNELDFSKLPWFEYE